MRKLILDLDTGIDDALALAYALGSPEVELVGIMGSYGNVTVETGVSNSLAILDLLGRPEVPVYVGANRPRMARAPFEVPASVVRIHGSNGLGEREIPRSTREPIQSEEPGGNAAADFLVRAVREYGKDLLYVPTGPLTNLAAALDRAPSLAEKLLHVTLMGGALTVPGNVSPCAEANIANDPEAADRVFRSGLHTTMVGLDVTHQTVLTHHETAVWRGLKTPAGTFFAGMTDYYIDIYLRNNPHLGGCSLHDPLAVAAAIDPTLLGTLGINLKVDLEGPERGRTIGDDERLGLAEKTTWVAVAVDVPRFLREFMSRVGSVL